MDSVGSVAFRRLPWVSVGTVGSVAVRGLPWVSVGSVGLWETIVCIYELTGFVTELDLELNWIWTLTGFGTVFGT